MSVLLTADEPGEWALHCHLLNHMISGMMAKVTIGERARAMIALLLAAAPRA